MGCFATVRLCDQSCREHWGRTFCLNSGSLLAFAQTRTCRVLLWLQHLEELFARAPAPARRSERAEETRWGPQGSSHVQAGAPGTQGRWRLSVFGDGVPARSESWALHCHPFWPCSGREPRAWPQATLEPQQERQHFCAWDRHCVPLEGRGFASKKMDKFVSGWFLARGGEGGLLPVLGRGGLLQGGVREMSVLTAPAQRGGTAVGAAGPGLPAVCAWRCGWLCGSIY